MEEKKTNEQKLKNTMYALIAVAVVLLGALAAVWFERSALVKDLNIEKEDLTAQMVALQKDYSELSSDYAAINSQLDSSREQVAQLIDRIKKTEATNRSKIRQYEKELGTLRNIMKSYIAQIDSLNTVNRQLTADVAAARQEAAQNKEAAEKLTKTVESLEDQVATGAVVKARGIRLDAYNKSNKITDRSSRVVRLMTTLSLVENELAAKGPFKVFVRVKGPDGALIAVGEQKTFNLNGEEMICSASREVDYQGAEVEMSIYLNDVPEFVKGIYTVEAYSEQALLGTAELMLR